MQNIITKAYSQIGASHIRQNKPNQDSVTTLSIANGSVHILAVSDGHGSDRYCRSDIGSKLAVKVARQVSEQFFDPVPALNDIKTRLDVLARKLVFSWREEVKAHWENFPFSEAEEALLKNPDHIETAYGATLLIAIITPQYAVYLQLGDGDIVVIDAEQQISTPISPDADMIGTETHSLCEKHAEKYWRISTVTFAQTPRLVILATDGYANSYASHSSFLNMIGELYQGICQYGLGTVLDALPTWLAETTEQGCGDDISVALLSCDPCSPSEQLVPVNTLPDQLPHLINIDDPTEVTSMKLLKKGQVIFVVGKSAVQDLHRSVIALIQKRFY